MTKQRRNELRIIGGMWRSRKLQFPDIPELRPTPDRVRETLFNWLGQDLSGLHCLDLFAGSGALGFEAASRGAQRVVVVEHNLNACAALNRNADWLDAQQLTIVPSDSGQYLQRAAQAFDVIFLDPPFHQALVVQYCQWLEQRGWLKERAKIYVEAERGADMLGMPQNWRVYRQKEAGAVSYRLFQREHQLPVADQNPDCRKEAP